MTDNHEDPVDETGAASRAEHGAGSDADTASGHGDAKDRSRHDDRPEHDGSPEHDSHAANTTSEHHASKEPEHGNHPGHDDHTGQAGHSEQETHGDVQESHADAHDAHVSTHTDSHRHRTGKQRAEEMQDKLKKLPEKLEISSKFKREMFYALENARLADQPFKSIGYFLFFLIIANAVVIFISAEPSDIGWENIAINIFYVVSTFCFMLEYLTRIWIADLAYEDLPPSKARIRYVFSGWGAIDFLSFFPSIIFWFFPSVGWLRNFVSVIRLLRLIKMTRYMRGLRTIGRVLMKRRSEIVASFFAIAFLVFISCIAMYEIEHPAQPDKFNNLLSGLYWAVTTITATGYGDLVPITPLGRIVGSIIMFLSVALVAIPGGIFSAGFVAEYQHADRPRIRRKEKEEENSVTANEGEGRSRL